MLGAAKTRLETLGRPVDRIGIVAQGPGGVVERRHHRLARVEDRLEPLVERGELAEAFPHRRQAGHRRVVVVVERAVGLDREPGQLFGVGDHGLLGLERVVLPRLRRHLVDLVWNPACRGAGRVRVSPRSAPRIARLDQPRAPRPGRRARRGRSDRAARAACRIEQGLVLVLSVQIDQRTDRLAQGRGRHQLPVEKGAAPALSGDFTSHDQLLARRGVEDRLDYRRFFA
jgi:hypothetical protein